MMHMKEVKKIADKNENDDWTQVQMVHMPGEIRDKLICLSADSSKQRY